MKTKWCTEVSAVLCASVLLVLSGCAAKQAATRAGPQAATATSARVMAEPADARAILMRMARFLSQAPRFSVNVLSGYDAVQASGQKIEFGEVRKVTVSRPNRLRIEVEQSNGNKHLALFDGRDITVSSMPQNVYAQISRPGDIDGAIRYFINDLNMRLPLAVLLVSRLPDELGRRVQSLDYVERTTILGTPSHHLAGRTETVDFQVWVAEGDQPLPQRVVLTYKDAEGQPQFRALFSDWNLSPTVTDSMFAFTPLEEAKKIAFLPQLRQVAIQNPKATGQTGGQK